jgi:chromosome partitioning protein
VALNRPGIIVLACHRRGVGRTTLAAHLAVAFANSGKRVAVSDLDPKTNLAAWWDRRRTEDVRFVELTQGASRKQIQEAARGIELLVIDTPSYPFVTRKTIELADLVLVPAPPSKLDLESLGPTVDMIKRANRPMIFVMNGSKAGTRDAPDAVTVLSRYGKVAPVRVAEHSEFAEALTRGLVASELNEGATCGEEIDWLSQFLLGQLRVLGNPSPAPLTSSFTARVKFQPG